MAREPRAMEGITHPMYARTLFFYQDLLLIVKLPEGDRFDHGRAGEKLTGKQLKKYPPVMRQAHRVQDAPDR